MKNTLMFSKYLTQTSSAAAKHGFDALMTGKIMASTGPLHSFCLQMFRMVPDSVLAVLAQIINSKSK